MTVRLCWFLPVSARETIRFATVNANYRAALEELAARYEELHPGVKVELSIVTEEFATWIRTRMAAGGDMVPDIYNANFTPGFGELGRWVDLGPYLEDASPYTGTRWQKTFFSIAPGGVRGYSRVNLSRMVWLPESLRFRNKRELTRRKTA